MNKLGKRLTLFSSAEYDRLYKAPDFTEQERNQYFMFDKAELELIYRYSTFSAKVYCALQVGYFKAQQNFYLLAWDNVSHEDMEFILSHYFSQTQEAFHPEPLSKHDYYRQRKEIAAFFSYCFFTEAESNQLKNTCAEWVRQDANPQAIIAETLVWLDSQRIILPGYSTLQKIISQTLQQEQKRLAAVIENTLDNTAHIAITQLIAQDDTLSTLAALKQEAKDFSYRLMRAEQEKLRTLAPLYRIAKRLLPELKLSQRNCHYYAQLAHYYTVYELRRFKPMQTALYLLCYAWLRYQQVLDNLVEAFCYHLKQFDEASRLAAREQLLAYHRQPKTSSYTLGQLLQLFIDERLSEHTLFGEVKQQAFAILPKETLMMTIAELQQKPTTEMELRWRAIDKAMPRIRKHLRPLFTALTFEPREAEHPWFKHLASVRQAFLKSPSISPMTLQSQLLPLIPKRLKPYLLNEAGNLQEDRCEFWSYRQFKKRLLSGEFYLDDSLSHRCFEHELVAQIRMPGLLKTLPLKALQTPIEDQLKTLGNQLSCLWKQFNQALKKKTLKHIEYDPLQQSILWHRPKSFSRMDEKQEHFYSQLPTLDIVDVLYFVNEQCQFLKAFTPLQAYYNKQRPSEASLFAAILSYAMNYGLSKMAKVSDINYHTLEHITAQYLRVATLKAANEIICNTITKLPIYAHYHLNLDILFGALDGQKFETLRPTLKSRYSRKYFGKGKGVVAYTFLSNHIALQSQIISPHEHESYYAYDIVRHNTTDIQPQIITGDMHSINKANFAIFHWAGLNFRPRFSNLKAQLRNIYCSKPIEAYPNYLIKPAGQIEIQPVIEEWPTIQRVIVTLTLKETTQSRLIKKLCTYQQNKLRKAIFEFDKLIRSIYTLQCLLDPHLQKMAHHSQNRIESYHQLRAAIASVNGKKQLAGRNDIDLEVSKQSGRLIANAIVYYNSALLSKLLARHEARGDMKSVSKLKKYSPVAWEHLHFLGHYTFDSKQTGINLDEMIENLAL